MIVGNCKVCEPMAQALQELQRSGYNIIEQKVADYHFQQLYFSLSSKMPTTLPEFEGTKKIQNKIICDCHWSTIEIIEKI